MRKARTDMKMKGLLFIPVATLALALFAPAMFGSPISPCADATVSVYDAEGFQCSIDGYTLEDFMFSDSQTGGASLLLDSQINVDPTVTDGGISIEFSPVDGSVFSVPSGQTAEYILQYELDPPLPRITGGSVSTGPGDPVELTGQFCGNGILDPYVVGQQTNCSGSDTNGIYPATAVVDGNNMSTNYQFPSVVTDLDTRLILDLDGPANVTSFGTTVNVSPVPEPSALFLLPTGILALMLLRRRRKSMSC